MQNQVPLTTDIIVAAGPYLTVIIAIVALCATILGGIAFWRADGTNAKTFSLLVQRAGALQLVTIMTIIGAGCFLSLIGKVNPEGIISLLSGIAGYVLGSHGRQSAKSEIVENSN